MSPLYISPLTWLANDVILIQHEYFLYRCICLRATIMTF